MVLVVVHGEVVQPAGEILELLHVGVVLLLKLLHHSVEISIVGGTSGHFLWK